MGNGRIEQILEAYERLRHGGIVKTKKEFADAIGVNYSSIIQAMKGDPRYLTDSLLLKVNNLLRDSFPHQQPVVNPSSLRPGSIVIPPELAQMFTDLAATVRSQQETISRLASASAGAEKKNA